MPRNFDELRKQLPAEAQARAHRRATTTLEKMALHELRRERRQTQNQVAKQMNIAQGAVSKIEQRAEMRLGTLRDYVRALGGRLEMRAVFPEKSVELRVTGDSSPAPQS